MANDEDTVWGEVKSFHISFACGDSTIDHQGNWYKTKKIVGECWLAENMRCTTSPSGKSFQYDGGKSQTQPRYYNYTAATQFTERERGLLYNWAAALDTFFTGDVNVSFSNRRGICPKGWHLPNDVEWKFLEKAYLTITNEEELNNTGYRGTGAGIFAGGNKWTSGGIRTSPGNLSYIFHNQSGFNALPVGYYDAAYSKFTDVTKYTVFWTSDSYNEGQALTRGLYYNLEGMSRNQYNKEAGNSVRCVCMRF